MKYSEYIEFLENNQAIKKLQELETAIYKEVLQKDEETRQAYIKGEKTN